MDVALAVDLIESALLGPYDAAVVFSTDTDLLPAVETAFRRTPARIEVASWGEAVVVPGAPGAVATEVPAVLPLPERR